MKNGFVIYVVLLFLLIISFLMTSLMNLSFCRHQHFSQWVSHEKNVSELRMQFSRLETQLTENPLGVCIMTPDDHWQNQDWSQTTCPLGQYYYRIERLTPDPCIRINIARLATVYRIYLLTTTRLKIPIVLTRYFVARGEFTPLTCLKPTWVQLGEI